MKISAASDILHEVSGRQYSYLKEWGLSTIREAIRTVRSRKRAPVELVELAESTSRKIYHGRLAPGHWQRASDDY